MPDRRHAPPPRPAYPLPHPALCPTAVPPQQVRRRTMADAALNNGTVLVVDDEPALCKVIRMILELEGYRVATVTSGQDAVACALAERRAVVLLDLGMPGTDGR